MNRFFAILTSLFLALWAGSLVHLLLTVATLFRAFPKAVSAVAIEAAPQVFWVTERYHLALSAITLVLVLAWRQLRCCGSKRWMIALVGLASVLAFTQTFIISAKMDAIRERGESGGPAFKQLHGVSSTQYLIQTALVLGSVALLPTAITGRRDPSALPAHP